MVILDILFLEIVTELHPIVTYIVTELPRSRVVIEQRQEIRAGNDHYNHQNHHYDGTIIYFCTHICVQKYITNIYDKVSV